MVSWTKEKDEPATFSIEFDGRVLSAPDFEFDCFVELGAKEFWNDSTEGFTQYGLNAGGVLVDCAYSLPSRKLINVHAQIPEGGKKVRFTVHEGSVELPCYFHELVEALGEPSEVQYIGGAMEKYP
jgi:hypothetical protein